MNTLSSLCSSLCACAVLAVAAPTASAVSPGGNAWVHVDAGSGLASGRRVERNLPLRSFDPSLAGSAMPMMAGDGLAGAPLGAPGKGPGGPEWGTTSAPARAGMGRRDPDFNAAFAPRLWSSTGFPLPAGGPSVTGSAIAFARDGRAATGAIMPVPVPEPSAWALASVGLVLSGLALRRRST